MSFRPAAPDGENFGRRRRRQDFGTHSEEKVMTGTVESKLAELGIVLPTASAPVANDVGFVRTGRLLMVSGQICTDPDGMLVAKGKLGAGVSVDDGQKA